MALPPTWTTTSPMMLVVASTRNGSPFKGTAVNSGKVSISGCTAVVSSPTLGEQLANPNMQTASTSASKPRKYLYSSNISFAFIDILYQL
jgi:hypothetical protein